jgi:hypothetical protein
VPVLKWISNIVSKASLSAASLAGKAVRHFRKSGPGIGGAALICIGFGKVYAPAVYIGAGVFLMLLDRKRP